MAKTIGSFDLASLKNLRDDVTQYFWFESDSSSAWGSGAHVTLYPESQFTDSTSPNYMKGQNIIMNTDGFSIRNGALPMMVLDNDSLDFNAVDTSLGTYTTMATFGLTGATIGRTGESHLEMDFQSLTLIDRETDPYFSVSDLRDKNGEYEFTESFTITNLYSSYPLSLTATNTSYTVTFSPSWSGNFTKSTTSIYFPSNPPNGTVMTVTYTTTDQNAKEYTFGLRGTGVVGPMSIASNYGNVASGKSSHAEGDRTTASGYASHAEGGYTNAYGGGRPTASGYASHAEGVGTKAISEGSHAEGDRTRAEGYYFNHAEGSQTVASGYYTHAEGCETKTEGEASHAEGYGTVARGDHQTVVGRYNKKDSSGGNGAYAFIVGNGTDDDSPSRSNALTVDWDGNVVASGDVTDKNNTKLSKVRYTGDFLTVAGSDSMSNLSATANTWATIGTIELPAGTWTVTCRARFKATSSGAKYSQVGFTSSSTGTDVHDSRYAPGDNVAQHNCTFIVRPSSTTTYYLRGKPSVAGQWIRNVATAYRINAVRII